MPVRTVSPPCQDCYERHYTHCTSCGCVIHAGDAYYIDDDDEPYCSSCYHDRNEYQTINDYNYKPNPIFYGNGDRFFGVELEIDGAGECNSNAERIIEAAHQNGLEYIYCKHDGSLEDGIEIVTHPMSPMFHQHEMPKPNRTKSSPESCTSSSVTGRNCSSSAAVPDVSSTVGRHVTATRTSRRTSSNMPRKAA